MIKSIKKISKKHYIQCGLAVLLTGLILYFTSALWSNKAIIVSFSAESKKDIQYQIFYTEDNGQGFNEKQSVRKDIKSGSQKVEILLPIEKIVKIRLDIGSNPGEVEISDLQVKGGKNIKLNYNEFNQRNIDKYEVKDVELYITSNQGDPYLSYMPELNLPAGMQIDWCRLIIISVLAFLLMYKFVQYLSKFKIEKHHSRIDIVMLAVFFALLFVPMSHISDAEKSEQEKRMLAKKPQLLLDNRSGGNFSAQFDAWYNDHFFGRDVMMSLYQNIKYFIAPMIGNDKILVGKDGWLFFKPNNSMENYANITDISEDRMQKGLEYLKAVNAWCEKHNKKFYYIIIPDKHRIYGENYRLIRKQRSDDFGIAKQFVNYIRENSDINVMYLQDELLKYKNKGLLYFKEGTHWSDLGAYYAYNYIINNISEKFLLQKIKVDKWNDVYASDPDLFRVYIKDKKVSYGKIYKSPIRIRKASCQQRTKHGRLNDGEVICQNRDNEYGVFVLRDSFFSWLTSYMADTFNKTKILWKYNLETEDIKDIEQNYDIVILENVERFIPIILNQKFPDLPKEN